MFFNSLPRYFVFYTVRCQKLDNVFLISHLFFSLQEISEQPFSFEKTAVHTVELQWLEHRWLVYHGYFEHVLESLTEQKYLSCSFYCVWDISGDFLYILKMVCCVYSLESPRWGDSNENTQHTCMLKKIKKPSLLSLLTWRYNQPLTRTALVSN